MAESRSRNVCRSIHFRRTTTSCSIIATCAAGPPKAVKPSLRNKRATSLTRPDEARLSIKGEGSGDDGSDMHTLSLRRSNHLHTVYLRSNCASNSAREQTSKCLYSVLTYT